MKVEVVTTLKRQATRLIAELKTDPTPLLITEHGRPAAYLVNVEQYNAEQERLRVLESIARGERALQKGNTLSHEQVRKRLKQWLD